MRILFIHQNMPGQYRGLMPYLAKNGSHQIIGIGEAENIKQNFSKIPENMKLIGYQMPKISRINGHPFVEQTEAFTYRGEVVARVLTDLKSKGFTPDAVCSHQGWGESLFVKDVYPDTKLINYCEFFYRSTGQDFNFDPEFAEKPGAEWNLRSRNAIQLLGLDAMDAGISPMAWQAKTFPAEYAKKISVIHEGVDTNVIKPDPKAGIVIKDKNLTLTAKNEVITFVSRNLEPYRGFHIFMRALPELLAQRPNAHVIIIGGDGVSYGKTLLQGTYRQLALKEVGGKIDHSRVHFIGKVPYIDYLRVLQISTAHVYLTYPFVLSWSMLEAMAAGCLIIGSRTPPVEEVIKHGQNGLLVDFFSPSELVKTICSAVRRKDRHQNLREEARKTVVDKYNFERVCLPKHLKLLGIK